MAKNARKNLIRLGCGALKKSFLGSTKAGSETHDVKLNCHDTIENLNMKKIKTVLL
jgi:hypothetical protein